MKNDPKQNRRTVQPEPDPAALGSALAPDFATLHAQQPRLYHLAVREAEAIAWQTPYPLLVLPALLEEKLKQAAGWFHRQRSLQSGPPDNDQSSFAA